LQRSLIPVVTSFPDSGDLCSEPVAGLIKGSRAYISGKQTPPAQQIQHAQSRGLSRAGRANPRDIWSNRERFDEIRAKRPATEQQYLLWGKIKRPLQDGN